MFDQCYSCLCFKCKYSCCSELNNCMKSICIDRDKCFYYDANADLVEYFESIHDTD